MIYQFQDYEFNENSRTLHKNGKPVHLQPKPFEILRFLISNRDRVVSKDELHENLWGNIHLSETALTRCIMKARRAVGDDTTTPSIIRTVHGHGYQFIADVEVSSTSTQSNDRSTKKKSSIVKLALVSAMSLIATLTIASMLQPAQIDGVRVAVLPFENKTGDADLDWTELGLMSVVNNAVGQTNMVHTVAPVRTINLAGEDSVLIEDGFPDGTAVLSKLRAGEGATHIIIAELSTRNEVYALEYAVLGEEGVEISDTVIGDTPSTLATLMGRDILHNFADITHARELGDIDAKNPFVSEAFARGNAFRLTGDLDAAQKMFKAALESDPENPELQLLRAVSLSEMAKHDEANVLFKELIDDLDGEADPKTAARVYDSLAFYHQNIGDMETSKDYRIKSLKYAELSGDRAAIGKAERGMGEAAAYTFKFDEAREYYTRAHASFKEAGLDLPPGYLLGSMAILEAREGNYADADIYFEQVLERFKLEGDDQKVMYTYLNIGILRFESGKWPQSEAYFEEALKMSRDVNDLDVIASSLVSLGLLEISKGDFEYAERVSAEALKLTRDANYKTLEAFSLRNMGMMRRRQGNLQEATDYFSKQRDIESELDNKVGIAIADAHLAYVTLDRADYTSAEAQALKALNAMRESGGVAPISFPLSIMAEARLETGRTTEAITALEEALAYEKGEKAPVEIAVLQAKLGQAHLKQNEITEAENYLRLAQATFPDLHFTLMLEAELELEKGNRKAALEILNQARVAAGDNWIDKSNLHLKLLVN
ncbi:MAG: tetratricopeptide repeat protein [Pseudomonadota bacterium]